MIAVKLPSFIHGVHTINLHNFVNEPFVPSYLLACSSPIRVFFSSSAIAVAEPAATRISAAAEGRRGRKSSGGDVNGFKRENGSGFVEEGEREERNVRCEVDVISWRERRIKGEIWFNADPQSVWDALTDYERLADFIPNLVSRVNWASNWEFSSAIPWHPSLIWLDLIKSVLSSIILYWLQFFHIPLAILDDINRILARFLWTGNPDSIGKSKWLGTLSLLRAILGFLQGLHSLRCPDTESADECIWVSSKAPHFSAKKTRYALRSQGNRVAWHKLIWFDENIPKQSFITWLMVQDKLAIKSKLLAWRIISNSMCSCCNSEDESRDHLFFGCEFMHFIWGHVTAKCKVKFKEDLADIIHLLNGLTKRDPRVLNRIVLDVRNRIMSLWKHNQVGHYNALQERLVDWF